jgi:hypothetical protein
MLVRLGTLWVCAILLAVTAGATCTPEVWQATGSYYVNYATGWVYVRSIGNFYIQAKDGGNLCSINGIAIDPNYAPINGTVNVYVLGNDGHGGAYHYPGAVNVRQVDLHTGVTNW